MYQLQQKIIILHTSPHQKALWLKLLHTDYWSIEAQPDNIDLIQLVEEWLAKKIPFPLLLLIDMGAKTPDGHFLQATAIGRWCKENNIPLRIVGLHGKQKTISTIESNWAKVQGLEGILPVITGNNYEEIIASLEEILGKKLNFLRPETAIPVKEKTRTPIQEKTPLPIQEKTPPLMVKDLPSQKPENSLEFLNQELKENPQSASLYCQRGELYLSLGDEKAAFLDFQQALKLDSKFEPAYVARGFAFYNIGNYAAAIKNLDQALKLNDKNPISYHQRGLARFHSGDEGGARKDYDQAIKLKPDFSQAYNDRAFVLYLLGKTKEALQNYDLAIKYNPHLADPYYNRGNIYSDLARFEEAIEDYTQAIRCNPNLAPAYGNRGIAYYELDQVDLAIQDTTTSANLFKNQGYQEDYRQALETLKEMKSG
jgi:tetratricopeptide (TPR) repeat protein